MNRMVVGILLSIDLTIFSVIGKALEWMEDWLSIPRGKVEKAMLLSYVVSTVISDRALRFDDNLDMVLRFTVAFFLWRFTVRATKAQRIRLSLTAQAFVVRLIALFVVINLIILAFVWPGFDRIVELVQAASLFLLLYLLGFGPGDGERGKRRKAALDKIKAMFGTSWMPAPLPTPS